MPFRSIVATPEQLAFISAAFDKAWAEIERCGGVDPLSEAAERERLGYIVAELWKTETPGDLATLAVGQFFRTAIAPPSLPNEAKTGDGEA
jgi:hypothetical protein